MPKINKSLPLHFEDCIFDIAARRVMRGGDIIALEPKMYDLLEILIERQPSVVTNEELDEALWPNVYVARTSLTRLISELRTKLGDNAREPHIIRTVYKKGYAFSAAVTQLPTNTAQLEIALIWRGQQLSLSEGEQVLGRGNECDLVVDADTVSRRHARISIKRGSVSIEDLNSKNGTHINGVEISSSTELNDGCDILLGSEPLTLRRRNPAAVTVLARPAKMDF